MLEKPGLSIALPEPRRNEVTAAHLSLPDRATFCSLGLTSSELNPP